MNPAQKIKSANYEQTLLKLDNAITELTAAYISAEDQPEIKRFKLKVALADLVIEREKIKRVSK